MCPNDYFVVVVVVAVYKVPQRCNREKKLAHSPNLFSGKVGWCNFAHAFINDHESVV